MTFGTSNSGHKHSSKVVGVSVFGKREFFNIADIHGLRNSRIKVNGERFLRISARLSQRSLDFLVRCLARATSPAAKL